MASWQEMITTSFVNLATKRKRYVKFGLTNALINIKEGTFLNFISNDYLGLSSSVQLQDAVINSIQQVGVGSTGAGTLSGYHVEEKILAENLATWLNYEKCLIFSSGYLVDIGIYKALVSIVKQSAEELTIWLDKRAHASHIDGILLSRAKFITFDEINFDNISNTINLQKNVFHIILTEGSFSMDGMCTYLDKVIDLKKNNRNNIMLIIDDAHGIGAIGSNGKGSCHDLDLNQIDLLIGTFGKAFATHGGFICGAKMLIDYLEQTVRSKIFTTCLPPALFAATNTSLDIIRGNMGGILRQQLQANIEYFQKKSLALNLPVYNAQLNKSPIQLLIFDNSAIVEQIHSHLFQHQIMVAKIVYPTVNKDTPRIRISLTAKQSKNDIDNLCLQISKILYPANEVN